MNPLPAHVLAGISRGNRAIMLFLVAIGIMTGNSANQNSLSLDTKVSSYSADGQLRLENGESWTFSEQWKGQDFALSFSKPGTVAPAFSIVSKDCDCRITNGNRSRPCHSAALIAGSPIRRSIRIRKDLAQRLTPLDVDGVLVGRRLTLSGPDSYSLESFDGEGEKSYGWKIEVRLNTGDVKWRPSVGDDVISDADIREVLMGYLGYYFPSCHGSWHPGLTLGWVRDDGTFQVRDVLECVFPLRSVLRPGDVARVVGVPTELASRSRSFYTEVICGDRGVSLKLVKSAMSEEIQLERSLSDAVVNRHGLPESMF